MSWYGGAKPIEKNPGQNRMSESVKWYWLSLAIIVAFLIWLLSPVLMPFISAALLAYLGDPVVDRLEARKLPRGLAVTIVFVLIFTVIVLLPLLLLPALEHQLSSLMAKLPQYADWVQHKLLDQLGQIVDSQQASSSKDLLKSTLSKYWQQIGGFAKQILAALTHSGLAMLAFLANLVLIPVLTFYLLRDWDILVAKIHGLLPRQYEPRISTIARESDAVLSEFLRGQLLVMLALATIYALGLSLVGLDLGLLIGLVAGLVSFVPYLGFIVGLSLAGAAAAFQFHDISHLLAVLAVFAVGQTLEGMVLTPKLVGEKIGLHPVAVIFAVMAGGQLFGMFGILLALPVAAVVMVLLRHVREFYTQSGMY